MSYKKKLEYIDRFFKYWTMNPWNRTQSFAFNIKVYNIIPKDLRDKAYDLLGIDDPTFWKYVSNETNSIVKHFCGNNYSVYTNGRSGGYLVLMKDNDYSYFNSAINDLSDILGLYENGYYEDYQYEVERRGDFIDSVFHTVRQFKRACGYIQRFYIETIKTAQIEQIEVVSTQKIISY